MQNLSKLLEYAIEQREKALSDNTLYTVTYWNGYIDAISRLMEASDGGDHVIKLGDTVTAKSNINEIITGVVTVINNGPGVITPSVLVRTKSDGSQWCYLSDNPELEVPKVFEKMQQQEEE